MCIIYWYYAVFSEKFYISKVSKVDWGVYKISHHHLMIVSTEKCEFDRLKNHQK